MENTDIPSLARSLSSLERKLLPFLESSTTLTRLVEKSGLQDVEVQRALMWFENRLVIKRSVHQEKMVILGENGILARDYALPEIRILKSLRDGPKLISQLVSDTLPQGEIMACIGILKFLQSASVQKTDAGMQLEILPAGIALVDNNFYAPQQFFDSHKDFPLVFKDASSEDKNIISNLSKRKDMLNLVDQKTVFVELLPLGTQLIGADFDFSDIEEQLTASMLKTGSWKNKTFRTYDVKAPVPSVSGGRRHPLREACNLLRDVYLSMGFQEMSGPWVETAFWCMDAMWIPQDHPARDEQDTFFIGKKGDLPDAALVQLVKDVHETGATTGSTGHGSPWNPEIARELILRTHSTATTFRMFKDIDITKDGKYFYIANIFRNEAVDATHIAEFLQAEGFVIGDNLSLTDLMGFIKEFYARLGIAKIRFKPTYNPYTEPSLEAHYYDEKKDKWYALINSGIFRPESLYPFGINKSIIAWGMGASRVAALLTKKNNLRDLVGPTIDFDWIAKHNTPQPNLEK